MTKPCVKFIKDGVSTLHVRRNIQPRKLLGKLSAYIAGKEEGYYE